MRLVRLALVPRGAPIATKEAAPTGAGVVVSVAAENGKDNLLPLEVSKVDVSIVANATTGAG